MVGQDLIHSRPTKGVASYETPYILCTPCMACLQVIVAQD